MQSRIFLALLAILSFQLASADETEFEQELATAEITTTKAEIKEFAAELDRAAEVGVQLHSVNKGSQYLNLGYAKEISHKWDWGTRALLPLDYVTESQLYMGQIFGRYHLLRELNDIAWEISVNGSYLNSADELAVFFGLGGAINYTRQLSPQFSAGVSAGVDGGPRVINDHADASYIMLYNKLAVFGSYAY